MSSTFLKSRAEKGNDSTEILTQQIAKIKYEFHISRPTKGSWLLKYYLITHERKEFN